MGNLFSILSLNFLNFKKSMTANSKIVLNLGILHDHRKKDPFPLPILEFLDFVEMG